MLRGMLRSTQAQPLRKDDTQIREAFQIFAFVFIQFTSIPFVHAKKSSKEKQKHQQQREKEHINKAKSNKKQVFASWCKTCFTPQGWYTRMQALSVSCVIRLQIKNIKLHIVTDIKVNFNSMLGFRISLFGWGDGFLYILMK